MAKTEEEKREAKRQRWINYIMKHKYGSDSDKSYDRNYSYLESLSDIDLELMYDSAKN